MAKHRDPKQPAGRWHGPVPWRALWVVPVSFALASLLSHVLLGWSLARVSAGDLHVTYQHSFSALPGALHVRSLKVSRPGAWALSAESLEARLSWWALLRARPDFHSVQARGVRLKLAERAPRSVPVTALRLPIAGASAAGAEPGEQWTVDHLNAEVESIEDGARRLALQGGVRLSADNVRGATNGVLSGRAVVELRRTLFERQRGGVTHLTGTLEAKHARLWLRGSLAPTALIRCNVEAEGGDGKSRASLRGPLQLHDGRPMPPTRLVLELHAPASWREGTLWLELAQGAELEVVAADDGRVFGTVRAPRLSLGAAGSSTLKLRSLKIERIWLRNLLRVQPRAMGLSLEAEDMTLETSAWPVPIESAAVGRLSLLPGSNGEWSVGSSTLELPSARIGPHPGSLEHRVSLRLALDHASLSPPFDFSGRLELSGGELQALLQPFAPQQSLRLLLAPFLGQPFRAQARLTSTKRGTSLRELRLTAGELTIAGDVDRQGTMSTGALLVSGPLGRVGVELGAHEMVVFNPPPDWLARRSKSTP